MSTLKKYKTAIIYVTIGVTIGLILSPFIYNNKSHNVEGSANEYIYELDANKVIAEQGIAESLVGMITKDNIITQTISFRDNAKIKYLGILVGTYQRSNQGNLTLELLDNSNNLVYSNTINKQQLTDNSYYYVDFKYTKVYENIDYKLVIKDDTDKNNAITLYCSKENVFNGGHLEVNSVSQVSDLTFKIVGKNFNR